MPPLIGGESVGLPGGLGCRLLVPARLGPTASEQVVGGLLAEPLKIWGLKDPYRK